MFPLFLLREYQIGLECQQLISTLYAEQEWSTGRRRSVWESDGGCGIVMEEVRRRVDGDSLSTPERKKAPLNEQ